MWHLSFFLRKAFVNDVRDQSLFTGKRGGGGWGGQLEDFGCTDLAFSAVAPPWHQNVNVNAEYLVSCLNRNGSSQTLEKLIPKSCYILSLKLDQINSVFLFCFVFLWKEKVSKLLWWINFLLWDQSWHSLSKRDFRSTNKVATFAGSAVQCCLAR